MYTGGTVRAKKLSLKSFQIVKRVHFDRKKCQNQIKNLSYKTEFGAK